MAENEIHREETRTVTTEIPHHAEAEANDIVTGVYVPASSVADAARQNADIVEEVQELGERQLEREEAAWRAETRTLLQQTHSMVSEIHSQAMNPIPSPSVTEPSSETPREIELSMPTEAEAEQESDAEDREEARTEAHSSSPIRKALFHRRRR